MRVETPPIAARLNAPMIPGLTQALSTYLTQARSDALPAKVGKEASRTFLNWMGCVLGGCQDDAVSAAHRAVELAGTGNNATVIGRKARAGMAEAAFLNALSSSVNSFDDTHLATVTHPTGPVAAALLAYSEQNVISGADFLSALALGIEIECRLSNALLQAPARANLGLFITGITGPVGAAAALGRVMNLDESRMVCALGLAATQAAGFRATHGAMAAFFVPAHAARSGLWAALLAREGLTSTRHLLEGPKGFLETFGPGADPSVALRGLGTDFELLANAYKPYPSGIVAQPVIDACLELAEEQVAAEEIDAVHMHVHPLALDLTGRREPAGPVEAQISLFHWAAACLVRRAAGLAQLDQSCIDDPAVKALRSLITAEANDLLGRDEARVIVRLRDGSSRHAHVAHARGSKERPMTDAELDAKFMAQACSVMSEKNSEHLLRGCRELGAADDVGVYISERFLVS